jgi:hypothetical protein
MPARARSEVSASTEGSQLDNCGRGQEEKFYPFSPFPLDIREGQNGKEKEVKARSGAFKFPGA